VQLYKIRAVANSESKTSPFSTPIQTRGPGATSLTWIIKANCSYVNTYKSNFPTCCFTLYLGAMTLYETHFCIWIGNFHVNLNSSGAVHRDNFYNLTFKTHLKMVFPNVVPAVPPPAPSMILKSWFCNISESFYVNLKYAGSVVIQKKILKIFSIETHIK
jgi:hypothetical protein